LGSYIGVVLPFGVAELLSIEDGLIIVTGAIPLSAEL